MDNIDLYLTTIISSDGPITRKAKTEGNILLSSVINEYGINSDEFRKLEKRVDVIISLSIAFDSFKSSYNPEGVEIVEDFLKLVNDKTLSPLTLEDDEFTPNDEKGNITMFENKRYKYVDRYDHDVDGKIYSEYINANAFEIKLKAAYDHDANKEIKIVSDHIPMIFDKVYITKGGVVTGDYIQKCLIDKFKNRDYSFLTNPIELPVSIIYFLEDKYKSDYIYTIDSRDPHLKLLKQLYNVDIKKDESIKGKFDIRKYFKVVKNNK